MGTQQFNLMITAIGMLIMEANVKEKPPARFIDRLLLQQARNILKHRAAYTVVLDFLSLDYWWSIYFVAVQT